MRVWRIDRLSRAKRALGRERDEVAREGASKTPPSRSPLLALFASLALVACDESPPEVDASIIPADAGVTDAGPPIETDAGPLPRVDAGTDAGPPPAALVRFVHAAPGVGAVDLWGAARVVSQDVHYRAATPYARVTPGEGTLSVTDADDPESAPLATSDAHTFEDGARYLALLTTDDAPQMIVIPETDPTGTEDFAVRVVNATHDTATLDVDLDGAPRDLEIEALAGVDASAWIGVDRGALRPVVTAGDATEPFSITPIVAPWIEAADRVLLVVVGRPVDARPSEVEGLSIVLVLEATETTSAAFVLRPDPRVAILQSAPRLPMVAVAYSPASGGDPVPIAPALTYGELVEATFPPGSSFVSFVPDGELFGPQANVDLLAGHRYLLITRGDPSSWGEDRFGVTVVRDAIEGDAHVLVNASPDTPGAMRWYVEGAPDAWAPVDVLPMPYGARSVSRGVEVDVRARLGLAREDRSAPNLFFDALASPGARGFVVLAGSYLAALEEPDAATLFYVSAPARGAWTVERASAAAGSGPLPDEVPAPPPPE